MIENLPLLGWIIPFVRDSGQILWLPRFLNLFQVSSRVLALILFVRFLTLLRLLSKVRGLALYQVKLSHLRELLVDGLDRFTLRNP